MIPNLSEKARAFLEKGQRPATEREKSAILDELAAIVKAQASAADIRKRAEASKLKRDAAQKAQAAAAKTLTELGRASTSKPSIKTPLLDQFGKLTGPKAAQFYQRNRFGILREKTDLKNSK